MIANEIKTIYEFHEYIISKEKVLELSNLILIILPGITEEQIKLFIQKVKLGEYGVLYKMPTSLMVMFQQFKNEIKPTQIIPEFYPIPNDQIR